MIITLTITADERDDVVDVLDVLSDAHVEATGVRRFKMTTHPHDPRWLETLASELRRRTEPTTGAPAITDRQALDQLAALVALPEWQIDGSGASWIEAAADIVDQARPRG